jgi:hypothetical protein
MKTLIIPSLFTCGLCLLVTAVSTTLAEPADDFHSVCNVLAYGAKGDGQAKDTAAVQKAIDARAERGGGTVHFPSGVYLSGSIHLRSNITLYLDSGATIKGSPDQSDYDPYEQLDFKNAADNETGYFHYALIWGEDIENVAITGAGTIDGNRRKRGGPKPIALKRCRRVTISGITLRNSPNYNISLLGTDNVNIDGVTILNGYCDGIDPDACRDVSISNCHIESWDDAIVPKASFSLGQRRSTENITVTNCRLATGCNAFKLGTESGGDFKRIAVSNCVMFRLGDQRPAISGIAIESVDGSNIDGVVVSNISMVAVQAPIFIRLGNRGRDMKTPVPGTLRNVVITNIMATGASLTSSVTGIPGHTVQGVTLSNIRITCQAGDPDMKFCDQPPEAISEYPDADMFGCLPAWGLFCRHVDGIRLSNVEFLYDRSTRWEVTTESARNQRWVSRPNDPPVPPLTGLAPAVVCDDVTQLGIDGLTAQPPSLSAATAPAKLPTDALIRFVNVRDALVRGCLVLQGTRIFLQVLGPDSRSITLIGNDLTYASQPLLLGEGVNQNEVVSLANRAR